MRDHFAFLSDRVERNHGFVVKTVGDAVMAAFSRPDDAVRAALVIQDDVASFNSARGGGAGATPIVLKLGLHAGACVAVTTGDALDYFGAIVNIAARLEHQCRGGEVIVSEAVAKDAETEAALADRERIEEKQRCCAASARRFGIFGLRSATPLTASSALHSFRKAPDFRRAIPSRLRST